MSFIFKTMLVLYQSVLISGSISNIYWHASKWSSISFSHWQCPTDREFSFPRFVGLLILSLCLYHSLTLTSFTESSFVVPITTLADRSIVGANANPAMLTGVTALACVATRVASTRRLQQRNNNSEFRVSKKLIRSLIDYHIVSCGIRDKIKE
jgi:hypothetical protein